MSTEKKARQVTHTVIVLDKSTSMSGTQAQTIKGVNEQIATAKGNADNQDILVSLVTFDDDVWEHFWEVPAKDMDEMPVSAYHPSGCTALWDGAYYAADKLRKTTTADENTAYLVIIITDGQENMSRHIVENWESMTQTRRSEEAEKNFAALRKELEGTGKWTFQFIGCDSGYIRQVAQNVGIRLDNCALWSNADARVASRGTKRLARASSGYYGARSKGIVMQCCTTSDKEGLMADYTSDDGNDAVVGDIQQPSSVATPDSVQKILSQVQSRGLPRGFHTSRKVDMSQPVNVTDMNADWALPPSAGECGTYGSATKVTWNG